MKTTYMMCQTTEQFEDAKKKQIDENDHTLI